MIIYWSNIPAPYTVERLNALARRDTLEFEAWFSARTEKDRSWTVDERRWEFRYRYLPGLAIRKYHFSVPAPLLRGFRPDLIVGLHIDAAFLLSQVPLRRIGVRTAFWLAPTSDAWKSRRRWREVVKRIVYPRVDAVLTTDSDGRKFATRYGANPERVFILPHFIDFEHFANGSAQARQRREEIRTSLGVTGVVFVYVGHLAGPKGVDYLLTAFAELQRRYSGDVSLLLVGDGPARDGYRLWCREEPISNVVFAGFRQRSELPEIYTAADVFVFPTLGDTYGHVVGEAMSCRLPVISTSAAGEIRERIEEGRSGFIVPPRRSSALLEKMDILARDSGLREAMGTAAFERADGQTAESWAEEFENTVATIMSLPLNRRRS